MDLLGDGAAWLEAQRHLHLTRLVTYQRGGDTVDLNATIGRTLFEQADAYGVIHRTESRDFLLRAEDLVLAGSTVLPVAGDQIREAAGELTYIYEVVAPEGEPPFRYSDPNRLTLRIHTKRVNTEVT